MKILFVSTNINTQFRAHLPSGVASLSAYLKQHGHGDVRVVHANKAKELEKLPSVFAEYAPGLVCVTATSCQALHLARIARISRQWNSRVPVVCGGIHPSLVPEEVLAIPDVDAVVRGEGEVPLLRFVESFNGGGYSTSVEGMWFGQDGRLIKNATSKFIEDLDSLPYMDREVVDYQRVIDLNNGFIVTTLSRGCMWNCTFCGVPSFKSCGSGTYVRNRSVENALGDIEQLQRRYRFSYIFYRDDTFTWDRNWTLTFCEAYQRRFKYPFDILTRSDCLDRDTMNALKTAGCKHIFLGLDSGNDFIRNDILGKSFEREQFIEVCGYLNSIGIKAIISNQVGLPCETPGRFQDTIEANREIHKGQVVFSPTCGAAPKIWVHNPFPGTPIYTLCKEKGWLKEMPSSYKVYRESYIDMPEFPRKEIDRMFRLFRYMVYKDSHPFFAWLFRIYDSRIGQLVIDLAPDYWFGQIRQAFSVLSRHLRPKNGGRAITVQAP